MEKYKVGNKIVKRCSRCHLEMSLEDFNKNKTTVDKLQTECRECTSKRLKGYKRKKNTNKIPEDKNIIKERKRRRLIETGKKMRKKYPVKWKARWKTHYAVRVGKIIRPKHCLYFLDNTTGFCRKPFNIQAHHYLGYEGEHWKDIQWLCQFHHVQAHYLVAKI